MGDHPRQVIVADADEGVRSQVQLALGEESYRVVCAHDAATLHDVVARHRPELLVIGADLPGAQGAEEALDLRSRPDLHDMAVLLLVDRAGGMEGDEPFGDARVDDVLAKPFNAFALLRKVAALLGP